MASEVSAQRTMENRCAAASAIKGEQVMRSFVAAWLVCFLFGVTRCQRETIDRCNIARVGSNERRDRFTDVENSKPASG